MKNISLIMLLVFTLVLSGCFSKGEDAELVSDTQIENAEKDEETEADVTGEVTEEEEVDEVELEMEKDENSGNAVEPEDGSEEASSSESEDNAQELDDESLEIKELESYEEDLEDLFKDILGELDDESASE